MSQQKLKIFIYYFIQNDPFDSLNEPNIYALPGSYTNINQVKAEHVYESFPLKFENYYLRFYLEDKIQNMKVWMDFPPDAKIPVYNDKAYVKVLRLPKHVKMNFKNTELFAEKKKKETSDSLLDLGASRSKENIESTNTKKEVINKTAQNANSIPSELFNSSSSDTRSSKSPEKNNLPKSKSNATLINVEDKVNPQKAGGFNIENIDFNEIGKKLQDTNQNVSSPNFEFLSSDNSNINTNNTKPSFTNGIYEAFSLNSNTSQKEELLNKFNSNPGKESKTISSDNGKGTKSNGSNNSTSHPLSELGNLNWNHNDSSASTQGQAIPNFTSNNSSSFPIDNIPSSLSEDETKERVDAVVKKWAFGVNEKKNLRFLLGTFHEVWTHEPMWKDVSMQTLIEDEKSVKTLYKKALGQTHPDKNMNKDFKTKYTADVLYNILTTANLSFS